MTLKGFGVSASTKDMSIHDRNAPPQSWSLTFLACRLACVRIGHNRVLRCCLTHANVGDLREELVSQ